MRILKRKQISIYLRIREIFNRTTIQNSQAQVLQFVA